MSPLNVGRQTSNLSKETKQGKSDRVHHMFVHNSKDLDVIRSYYIGRKGFRWNEILISKIQTWDSKHGWAEKLHLDARKSVMFL